MLNNLQIMFKKPWEARLHQEPLDDSNIPAGHALVKKIYSIISTGTEMACLSGGESWFSLPGVPGYACVCEVLKTHADVEGFRPGDRVFCYGTHTLYEVMPIEGIFMKIPDGLDPKWVPFTRMATIAATAVRASTIEWGDIVAVTGQGLVGNMALQLAKLQGAVTIAVDTALERLHIAKACGADHIIHSATQDAGDTIASLSDGAGVGTLVEATGVPAVATKAIEWVARNGEMILLGSPRGTYNYDMTTFLNHIHLADFNVTLKGAHEWKFPLLKNSFVKHSMERNSELVFGLMAQGKLVLDPLLTETAKPEDCFEVYNNMHEHKERYMGVLFDWQ